jgi:hypothetical protein
MSAPENLDEVLERVAKIERLDQLISQCVPLAVGDTSQPDAKDDFDDRLRASYVMLGLMEVKHSLFWDSDAP